MSSSRRSASQAVYDAGRRFFATLDRLGLYRSRATTLGRLRRKPLIRQIETRDVVERSSPSSSQTHAWSGQ
ncbi:hypothetical protein [Rhodococcus jostii]|uniref:hypothetical protein n=1 Tax=Rhodococcus jostii TaxID=132919 RepID=UPI003633C470